jgi:hypothetical protein
MLRGWFVGAGPLSGDRQSGQRRDGFRAGLLHDRVAMILDGALTDTEIRGDVLAMMA